jgi:hypothetical protein
MSKASEAGNAVMVAVEQVLDFYGVQHTREQSRVVTVPRGDGQGFRPMYFGKWIDNQGDVHTGGRADILARPKLPMRAILLNGEHWPADFVSVPLWIECKSGSGSQRREQREFQAWVTSNGDYYLLIRDDVNPLLEWLKARGVRKEPKRAIHADPMNTQELEKLPCRHCAAPKSEHLGSIYACPRRPRQRTVPTTVWSPQLEVKA